MITLILKWLTETYYEEYVHTQGICFNSPTWVTSNTTPRCVFTAYLKGGFTTPYYYNVTSLTAHAIPHGKNAMEQYIIPGKSV